MKLILVIGFGVLASPVLFAQNCAGSVGFKVAQISGLKTAVWYPTSVAESSYKYSDRASTGSVALNAPVANCNRFPLVVFSHGFGGCGIQSVFITEQLARNGYIVAAPDHKDAGCSVDGSPGSGLPVSQEPFTQPETWTDQTYADRKVDIQNLLTAILAGSEFSAVINPQRIVGMGHSLGGYTIFGLAGGWPSWKDPRIGAALLLSPYIDPFLIKGNVPNVTLPTMYQGAVLDLGITPSLEKPGGVYDKAASPKFFVKLPGGHLTWTNATCSGTVAQCLSSDSTAQAVNSSIVPFLDHYTTGADRPALWFRPTDGTVRVYRRSTLATSVSSASFGPALSPFAVASVFGEGIIDRTIVSPVFPEGVPQLGGLTAVVTDALGNRQNAQIFFVSASQVNVLIPAGTAMGLATVEIRNASDAVASGTFTVNAFAPALYSANRDGRGTPAGQYVVIRPDGSRLDGFLYTESLAAQPLNLALGQVYVALYGTGFRAGTADRFTAQIGREQVPILAAAPSPNYPGLDQIALGPLPPALAGAGAVEVTISIAGTTSNSLTLLIQ